MAAIVEFGKEAFREAMRDNITGEAAKVAYYSFLSFFPLILVVFALTGIVGGDAAFNWIMDLLTDQLPPDAVEVLSPVVEQITLQRRPGILSFGIVLTLWAASNVFAGLADGLNTMCNVEESRSWWRKRLVAIGMLLAAVVLGIAGTVAILAGGVIGQALGLGPLWDLLRFPLAYLLLAAQLALIYFFLPARQPRFTRVPVLLGALTGAALWIVTTLLFSLYVSNFGAYTETYGFVGGIIVLLIWLYLTGVVVLFGGVVTTVFDRRQSGGQGRGGDRTASPRAA